jgi:penicillin-binding protein 1A
VYQYPDTQLPFIGVADRATFYQLKTMLQGVVARGTARAGPRPAGHSRRP